MNIKALKDRQIYGPCQRAETVVEHKHDGMLGTVPQNLESKQEKLETRGRIETTKISALRRAKTWKDIDKLSIL